MVASGTKARAVRWGPAHSNDEQSVSAVIGPEGGRLSLPGSDFTMNIPSGALAAPTMITVVAKGGPHVAYEMLPHGLRFLRPVTAVQGLQNTATYGTDAGNAIRTAYLPEGSLMAVDRSGLVRSTFDSLGWRRGADGMRSRGKTPLAFSLIVPSSSAIRMKFAVLLQEQWRKAGANVRIEPLELNTFGGRMDSRKFESLLNGWHIDPTPSSMREEWASSEIRRGGYTMRPRTAALASTR